MKNKKGFTLIELLAVIAILAIIAVIATPMVLGIIGDARDKSLVNSAQAIWGAAEQCVAMHQIDDTMCTVPSTLTDAGFTNDADVNAGDYEVLSSMNSFGGEYIVSFTTGTTDIATVQVSNGDIASDPNVTIVSKDGTLQ